MTSPGTGSGVVGASAGPAGSGRSFRRRIIDRQVSTCGQAAVIATPLLPESRPEAGRSSRTRPPASKAAAVLAPTPLTPGTAQRPEVGILPWGDSVARGYLGRTEQPAARAHRGVEDAHRATVRPGVAHELVVILVHGRDQHVTAGAGRDQGGGCRSWRRCCGS